VRHSLSTKSSSFWTRPRHPFRIFATIGFGTLGLILVPAIAAATIFTAVLTNSSNAFSSGNLILSGSTPGPVVCASSGTTITTDAANCTGNPLPAATLSTTASSAATTLSSSGTLSATSGLVSSSGCGVAQFADASTLATNPALPAYGVTYGTTMSKLASTAASFDGSTGWAETVKSFLNPTSFSIAGWFNSSTAQGTLIGFSSVQTNAGSTSNDRELWLDSTGHLVWATTTGTVISEVTSPSTYNNGAWHFVVASIGSTNQDQLYVDGALVGSTTATTAYSYTGYWTLGWGSESSATPAWTDPPTSAYFKGTLAGFAVIPSQLSSAQVVAMNAATNQSGYNTLIAAVTPTSYWPLTDVGSTPYSGALPTLAATTAKFYDASGHTNTGSPGTGTVTGGVARPLSGTAITLNGAAGSAVNTTTGYANPQTFSQSIWFKTSSSGVLMGLTNVVADTTASADHDHMFWIDSTGHLVYGIDYGATPTNIEITSAGTYNNGAWHLAVATGSTTGTVLYVDGVQVASNATASTVQSYTGYWHLGYGFATGWTNPPTSSYLTGSLAHAAYYATTLTAAQVASLYAATTSGAEEYAVLILTPAAYWPLYDTITSPACATVEVTIGAVKGATTSCVEPYLAATTCAAPVTTVEANTLLPKAMPQPVKSTSVALTITLQLTATESVGVAGLHLLIPLTFTTQNSRFTGQISYALSRAVL